MTASCDAPETSLPLTIPEDFAKRRPMNILMAASEFAPYAQVGELGTTIRSLSRSLKALGQEVSVVLPFYQAIKRRKDLAARDMLVRFPVYVGTRRLTCAVHEAHTSDGLQIFLLQQDELYDRPGIYGQDGEDYADNSSRFIFFSKCIVELLRRMDPQPDLLHLHNWQSALAAAFAQSRRINIKTVLSVDSLAYQGNFWSYDFALTNLPEGYFSPQGLEFYGSLNLLKAGLIFADAVVLPGRDFVAASQTPRFGFGLDGVLREQQHKLHGIRQGLDQTLWNPARNKNLPCRFSIKNRSGKSVCRKTLLESLKLAPEPHDPVILSIEHATFPRRLDNLGVALDRILAADVRLIYVADNACPSKTNPLEAAVRKHPGKVFIQRDHSPMLLHQLIAGSDLLFIPSRLEPSGQFFQQAMRYGTIPVALASAGLAEIVQDFDPERQTGNGLVYYRDTPEALTDTLRRARQIYHSPLWDILQRSAMEQDTSWETSAVAYEQLYRQLTVS